MSQKKIWLILVCFVTAGLLMVQKPCFAETTLEKKTLMLINKTVFEVVVQKPTKDSLTYERELPLDLLPYIERTDKYLSVGTAFAISPTEFATASHVLSLEKESQYRDYFIRDVNGTVYAIDKILKYSSRRDFVVFSVKGRAAGEFLAASTAPELNNKVYAVGNALGEGIVIRDGLYTSNTPEDQNGEWKWLRFSAAASPGNSGGPLLDDAGNVIGIVLQKSPNENLNIALPIAEVNNAKPGVAHVYQKMVYSLDNMPMTKIDTLQQEIQLPKPYQQLNKEMSAVVDQFSAKLLERLLSENKSHIFPSGKESLSLLNKHYHEDFPRMIMKGDDGNWDGYSRNTRNLDLGNNGLIMLGIFKNSALMYIKKPNNITLDTFYRDSKVFMDTILKGLGITRPVGPDKIRITSLGKAANEFVFTDAYGRKWLVNSWNVEYNDTRFMTFSLPVPGGCITLMQGGQTWQAGSRLLDLQTLADFIYVSYCGSLKEWREFLTMGKLLPQVFSTMNINFEYGKMLTYKSQRLSFSLDNTNMKITEKSELHLSFGYFNEGNRTVWDIKEVTAGEDDNTATYYGLSRYTNPPKDLNDKDKGTWKKLVVHGVPFNNSSFAEDTSTKIETVYTGRYSEGSLETAPVLYSVLYRKEGSWGQKDMADALEAFQKKVAIFDDGYAK